MRLWSIHPKYLDSKGLVALWREGLLAQNVLLGETKGYKNHPQLERFKEHDWPIVALNAYLYDIYEESKLRRYSFNKHKMLWVNTIEHSWHFDDIIKVTTGQIEFELRHLLEKLYDRDFVRYKKLQWYVDNIDQLDVNSIFEVIPGEKEDWEKG